MSGSTPDSTVTAGGTEACGPRYEELLRSERRYRRLVERSLDTLMLTDVQGRFIYLSESAYDTLGYRPAELMGRGVLEVVHPDDHARVRAAMAELRAAPSNTRTVELRNLRPDGSWGWLQVAGINLLHDPDVQAIVATIRDITERRQAEEALRESEARYRTLFNSSPDAIVIHSLTGRFLEVNDAACRLYGYSRQELLRLAVPDLALPRYSAQFAGRVSSIHRGEHLVAESEVRRGDGTIVPLELSASAITHQGEPAVLSVVRDISERKQIEAWRRQIEARAQQYQKLESLATLAGGVAQELNNLLAAVMANADLALGDVQPGGLAAECLADILSASQRAAVLGQRMLESSGRGRFVVGELSLSPFVEETRPLLEAALLPASRLELRLAAGLPAVEADSGQLRQLLLHLVRNASEALGESAGAILVSTGAGRYTSADLRAAVVDDSLPAGEYAWLEVADTGPGMDAETLGRVFDPFFSTKFPGRGLGLAAALGIVRGHGGAIFAESAPGQGARFRVLLPAGAGEPPNGGGQAPGAGAEPSRGASLPPG